MLSLIWQQYLLFRTRRENLAWVEKIICGIPLITAYNGGIV
jgi:hypothetical protein